MMKTVKLTAAAVAALTLSACASNQDLVNKVERLESQLSNLQQQQSSTASDAASAQQSADNALKEARKAQMMADDANERAERMFEKCCRK